MGGVLAQALEALSYKAGTKILWMETFKNDSDENRESHFRRNKIFADSKTVHLWSSFDRILASGMKEPMHIAAQVISFRD